MLTRRTFIQRGALVAGVAATAGAAGTGHAARRRGYGPLVADAGGLLDLPRGFRYRVLQTIDDRLSDGKPVPHHFDGMAAFAGPGGTTVLVRNHELRADQMEGKVPVVGSNPYRPGGVAGTTGLLVGRDGRLKRSFVTSSGTLTNCAGGATPWGTWITCEEDRTTEHGYCFEVDPHDPENDRSRTPIRDMGFFSHEACNVDPRTGIVYLTEDDARLPIPEDPGTEVPGEARSSFLYRYLPEDPRPRPGALQEGGRLQALAIDEPAANMDGYATGDRWTVIWRDVRPEQAHEDALAGGCARFNRLEGSFFAGGAFWFDDTAGGERRLGQIFRYVPRSNRLELFLEGSSAAQMESPDNMTITPWGDLWFVEDGSGSQRVVGVTPDGDTYVFAENRLVGAEDDGDATELAGPTFSPDGRTFFVNLYDPGHTLAITGPFRSATGGGRRLASATPRHAHAPGISGELAEYAARSGRTPWEAAAFEALGARLG